MTTNARVAARQLESQFAEAMTQLYAVGNGLARLRAQLDQEEATRQGLTQRVPSAMASPPATPAPVVVPAAAVAAAPPRPLPPSPAPAPSGFPAPQPMGTPTMTAPPVPWWQRSGAVTRVLAITGAVVTLLGVAMLLVLAAQRGWLGPPARVTAGALLAAALVAIGVRLGARDRKDDGAVGAGPAAVVGTGVATAYLDVMAVTTVYDWVSTPAGLLLAGLLATGGLLIARRWSSQLLASITVTGAAILGPVVAGGLDWVVCAFLVLIALLGWTASAGRSWPVLTALRTIPATLALPIAATAADFIPGPGSERVGVTGAALVFALGTLATAVVDVRVRRDGVVPGIAVAGSALALLLVLLSLPMLTSKVALALMAVGYLTALAIASRPPVGPVPLHLSIPLGVAGAIAAIGAVAMAAPDRFAGTGLLLLAAAFLGVAGSLRSVLVLALGGLVTLVAAIVYLEHPFAVLSSDAVTAPNNVAGFVDSVAAGLVIATLLWAVTCVAAAPAWVGRYVTLAAWPTGLIVVATGAVSLGVLLGDRIGRPGAGFTAGHALATVTWMCAAAWLLLRGLDRAPERKSAVRLGLLVVAATVAKLFVYDLAALHGVWRSLAFIVTGLLLLLTGTLYAKAYERTADEVPARP